MSILTEDRSLLYTREDITDNGKGFKFEQPVKTVRITEGTNSIVLDEHNLKTLARIFTSGY